MRVFSTLRLPRQIHDTVFVGIASQSSYKKICFLCHLPLLLLHTRPTKLYNRVSVSTACAGFPANVRESCIRISEAYLDLAAEVAGKSCATALASASPTRLISSMGPSLGGEGRTDVSLGASADQAPTGQTCTGETKPMTETIGEPHGLIARGAMTRAGCLLAAQGLIDQEKGPRSAGESLAVSVLSMWASPGGSGEAQDERGGDGEGVDQKHEDKTVGSAALESLNGDIIEGSNIFFGTDKPKLAVEAKKDATGLKATVPKLSIGTLDSSSSGSATIKTTAACDRGHAAITKRSKNDSQVAVPLRDLRWGLELLLGCVAQYLMGGLVEKGSEASLGTLMGKVAGSFVNDQRGPTSDDRISTDPATVPGALNGQYGSGARDAPPKNDQPEDDGASRVACRLVDFACRCPHIGPALVASILTSWVPYLVQWRGVKLSTAPAKAQQERKQGPHIDQYSLTSKSLTERFVPAVPVRSDQVSWQCAPAGEAAAAEALASGAIQMLVYMVRHFPLLPLSDFSAETLTRTAEGGIAFAEEDNGVINSIGRYHNNAAKRAVERRNRITSGRARIAGEALILELFVASGGGGIDVLLRTLNTARGIACLSEASTGLFERRSSNNMALRQKDGRSDERMRVSSREKKLKRPKNLDSGRPDGIITPSRRVRGVAEVEVRRRVDIPQPPAPQQAPKPQLELSGEGDDASLASTSLVDSKVEGGTTAESRHISRGTSDTNMSSKRSERLEGDTSENDPLYSLSRSTTSGMRSSSETSVFEMAQQGGKEANTAKEVGVVEQPVVAEASSEKMKQGPPFLSPGGG